MTKYEICTARQDSDGNAVEWAIHPTNYWGLAKGSRKNSRKRIKKLCGDWYFTTLKSAQKAYEKLPDDCKV